MSCAATQASGQKTGDASETASVVDLWSLSPAQFEACAHWLASVAHETTPSAIVRVLRVTFLAATAMYALKTAHKRIRAQLLRALGIVPKSERQNARGKPVVDAPKPTRQKPKSAEERLENAIADFERVKDWHQGMGKKATKKKKAAQKRLDKLRANKRAKEHAERLKGQPGDKRNDVISNGDDSDDDELEETPEQISRRGPHLAAVPTQVWRLSMSHL